MTDPTDWHVREHDATTATLKEIQEQLAEMSGTLREIKTDRRNARVAGSYVIPGLVAVCASYIGRKLGL